MSAAAIEPACGFTYYHFCVRMWVIFALPGLAMGYFIYKRKLPPRLSFVFVPYSGPGKLIDILAIIGVTCGIYLTWLPEVMIWTMLYGAWSIPCAHFTRAHRHRNHLGARGAVPFALFGVLEHYLLTSVISVLALVNDMFATGVRKHAPPLIIAWDGQRPSAR